MMGTAGMPRKPTARPATVATSRAGHLTESPYCHRAPRTSAGLGRSLLRGTRGTRGAQTQVTFSNGVRAEAPAFLGLACGAEARRAEASSDRKEATEGRVPPRAERGIKIRLQNRQTPPRTAPPHSLHLPLSDQRDFACFIAPYGCLRLDIVPRYFCCEIYKSWVVGCAYATDLMDACTKDHPAARANRVLHHRGFKRTRGIRIPACARERAPIAVVPIPA